MLQIVTSARLISLVVVIETGAWVCPIRLSQRLLLKECHIKQR